MYYKEYNAFIDMGYEAIEAFINDWGLVCFLTALRAQGDDDKARYEKYTREQLLASIRRELEDGSARKISIEEVEKHAHLPKGLKRNKVKVMYNGKLTTWGELRPLTFRETIVALWYDLTHILK